MLYDIIPTLVELERLSKEMGDMPNIPFPTAGGETFWDDVYESGGWRVQVNKLTNHARILDENNVRQAWGSRAAMEEKLRRIMADSFLEPGDVIGINRGIYEHYAVYIGDDRVIHYAAENGDFCGRVSVHEAPMSSFLRGGKDIFVLNFSDEAGKPEKVYRGQSKDFSIKGESAFFKLINSGKYHLYSPEETVERAKSRLGETDYNLIVKNCEHFAIWCKTGLSESYQVDELLNAIWNSGVQMIKGGFFLW